MHLRTTIPRHTKPTGGNPWALRVMLLCLPLLLLLVAAPAAAAGQDVGAKLDDISDRLARIETKLDVAVNLARDNQVTLRGLPENGEHPGLVGRVQAMEGYQRLHASAIGVIGIAVVGGVVGLGRQAVARALWPRSGVRRSKPWIHGAERGPP